jgi:ribosomal protein S18 acetylase RimI-like enzyme
MIRSLRESDFARFLDLARDECWSCNEAELAAFLAADPQGCLVLEQRARAVGFVMAYPHERSAWIGNFILDPALRGRGLGTKLFEAVLEHLDELVPTVYLTAAPAATKLYRRCGFSALGSVSRWQLRSNNDGTAPARGDEHLAGLLALDERCWSDRRHRLLRTLISGRHLLHDEESGGYLALGRVDDHVAIGPFEMTHPSAAAARRLLERALIAARSIASDARILIDVPEACSAAGHAARSLGGTRISSTTCMIRGAAVPVDFTRIGSFASMGSKG